MSNPIPIEVSDKRLADLNKRLYPPDAISVSENTNSPQRFIIQTTTTLEKESNSLSTLEDYNSPNRQSVTSSRTPTSANSKSKMEMKSLHNDRENSIEKILENEDNEIGTKRQRETDRSDTVDDMPPVKSPTLKLVDDQNESGSRGASKKGTLESYFPSKNPLDGSFFQNTTNTAPLGSVTATSVAIDLTSSATVIKKELKSVSASSIGTGRGVSNGTTQQAAFVAATKELTAANAELKKDLESARQAKEQAENKLQRLESEFRANQERLRATEERNARLMKSLEDLTRQQALSELRRKRQKLDEDNQKLGRIVVEKAIGIKPGQSTFNEYFIEGSRKMELFRREEELRERKLMLDERKKQIMRVARVAKKGDDKKTNAADSTEFKEPTGRVSRKSQGGSSGNLTNMTANGALSTDDFEFGNREEMLFDISIDAEVIKSHLEQLKRDEQVLAEEKRLYETEKAVHQREHKRCTFEEKSNFYRGTSTTPPLPCLNNRYQLQQLLGKGGFSEVWKAFDLLELREVAVKVHQLNPLWAEERKQSYIKHVTREYTIHRDMKHPRIVQLFDVFEIDVNSFATVLDYCPGIDLDEKLKRCRQLPEKDAKIILQQILSGLRYLNRPLSYINSNNNNNNGSGGTVDENGFATKNSNKKLSIIHYDLKPANILFDETGDVKITDFGLSKIIDESEGEGTSMELTSQGAGTYWYLPPECFAKGHEQARISSKVDVWSAGVIFYQMLYGFRPYGEGKTQENVWSDGLIRDASPVEFPVDKPGSDVKVPKVSEDAKELIRECLTRDPRQRPDILAVCQNKYFGGGSSK